MPTISQLPVATAVNTGDLFVIVQSGITKQATDALVIGSLQSNIQINESQVTGLTADLAARLIKADNLSDLPSAATARVNLGLPALSNGQVWLGVTGLDPAAANITAGTGISIAQGAGSLTISATGSGTWINQNTSSVTMSANTGYTTNNGASLVTYTLPIVSTYGDYVEINGLSSGGWTIAQASGQQIFWAASSTTLGAAGTLSSITQYDAVRLRCIVPNTSWIVVSANSNLTIV